DVCCAEAGGAEVLLDEHQVAEVRAFELDSIEIRLARERELEVLALGKMVGRFLALILKGEKPNATTAPPSTAAPRSLRLPLASPEGSRRSRPTAITATEILADATEMPGTLTRPNTDSPAAATKTATPIDGQLNRCRRRVGPPRLGASC